MHATTTHRCHSFGTGFLPAWLICAMMAALAALAAGSARGAVPEDPDYLFTTWTVAAGLPDNEILGIAQDAEGFLWIATPAGLARFDGATFRKFDFTTLSGSGEARVRSLRAGSDRRLWMVLDSGAVITGFDGAFRTLSAGEGAPSAGAHYAYVDGAGSVIVSDQQGGVFRAKDGRLERWLDPMDTPKGAYAGINVDLGGTVWVRYDRVLYWRSGGRWEPLHNAPDSGGGEAGGKPFHALKTGPARQGGMWIGNEIEVRRFAGGRWQNERRAFGIALPSLQLILEDAEVNVWITTGGGHLLQLDPAGNARQVDILPDLVRTPVRHLFEDGEGNLWAGTEGAGIVRISPKLRQPSLTPPGPAVVIEELLGDTVPLWTRPSPPGPLSTGTPGLPIEIGPDNRWTDFEFTAINLTPRLEPVFQCQLDGAEENWRKADPSGRVRYENLAPGRYRFLVRAAIQPGVFGATAESPEFVVEPHFWQTWLFRLISAVLVILAATAVVQVRLRHLKRQRRIQQEFSRQLIENQESERKRIAGELHDSLGQKLLLIRNFAQLGLTGATPGDAGGSSRANNELRRVSDMAAECLEDTRQIARNLRPYQLDQMGLSKAIYSLAAEVERSSGIAIERDIDELAGLIPRDLEINVYRIVQEALNNVVRHSGARTAVVRAQNLGQHIVLEICDSGKGFTAGGSAGSFGLSNLRERAGILGGKCDFRSAPGEGTRLRFMLPAQSGDMP